MIARKLLLSAFALLTLAFVGCKDDEDNDDNGNLEANKKH